MKEETKLLKLFVSVAKHNAKSVRRKLKHEPHTRRLPKSRKSRKTSIHFNRNEH